MSPGLINWLAASSHVLTAVVGTGWRLTWQLHQENRREADCISLGSQGMHEQTERRSRRSFCELSVGSQVVSHDGAVWFERVLEIIRCCPSAGHFSPWKNGLMSSTLPPTARRRRPLPPVPAAAARAGGAALLPRFSFLRVTSLIVAHCTLCREQNRTLDGFIPGKAVALLTFAARCSLLLGRMFIAVKWPPLHFHLQPETRQRLAEKNRPEWHLFALLNDKLAPVEALVGIKCTELWLHLGNEKIYK